MQNHKAPNSNDLLLPCLNSINCTNNQGIIKIKFKKIALLLSTMKVAAVIFISTTIIFVALYLPDFLFDYKNLGTHFLNFFATYAFLIIMGITTALVVAKIIRQPKLFIDLNNKMIAFKEINSALQENDYIYFKEIQSLEIVPKLLPLFAEKLVAICNSIPIQIWSSNIKPAELRQLKTFIEELIEKNK